MTLRTPIRHGARAFTLIELILAVMIFGIVLLAINTVFYSAMRLQKSTASLVESTHEINQALTLLRRDLRAVMPPGGMLAASFKIGTVGTGQGTIQVPGVEFFASTGIISDEVPWGDIQKITYYVRPAQDRTRALGKDLIRSVTRNLLPTMAVDQPLEQRLLGDVESFEVTGYSGNGWRDTWDTTLTDTNLPTAFRVRIYLASLNTAQIRDRQPLELVVPVLTQGLTNLTSSATTTTQ